MTFTYKDAVYESVKSRNIGSYSGCAFYSKPCGGRELYRYTEMCFEDRIIFKKVKKS